MIFKVAMIVGSLRNNSYSGQVADSLAHMFSSRVEVHRIPIGELVLYNPDLDEEISATPESWQSFRESMRACDAVMFVADE